MNSRQKGKRGELELAQELRKLGAQGVRRTQQYCGRTGKAADLTGIAGLHIECKRVERLNIEDAMAQAVRDAAGEIPVVMHRKNRHEWLATLRLEDFMAIYSRGNRQ